ncbi:MAG: alpha-glucuronidase family glycosyl hydrolase, partial [Verrucomicrobiota bacterium]
MKGTSWLPLLAVVLMFFYFQISVAAQDAIGKRKLQSVAVVTSPNAPELEQFAARELCGYLDKLFGIQVKPTTKIPSSAKEIFLIGNPETNPLISKKEFPKVSDQGVVLKSVKLGKRSAVIVGGGSSRATLWAVYALAEKWGVRFLLHGDVLPARAKFKMPALNLQEEPALRVRQWRVLNEHAMGPISWGMADYRPVIDQLAKLRFNRLLLYIWPGQPFLPLEYKGIKQTSGTLFFGNHYPITDDMIGRSLFGNEKEFWNPDLPLPGDAEKLSQAAVKHVQALMDYARARGMECVMPANLTEFPREFKPLLAHLHPVDMVGTPTIGPGANANLDDPMLAGLARAVLETTLKTYPGLDYIALDLPEWREWVNEYERAWKSLDAKYGINKMRSLESILTAAKNRKDYSGGAERAVKEVKADIVALYFYDKIISDPQTKIGRRKFVVSTVAEELFPILAKIFPSGSETLNFVDYTPSRIVKRRDVLKEIPACEIPSVLIYTLHDDNVGVLPQLATHSLAELTRDIRSQGWAGFSTRYWLIGDHDPCVAYLSRAAWDTNATPEEIYRDQITRVCGEAAVPSMLKLFSEVEAATVTLEWHGLGLTFTAPHMMMQHWTPGALSPELKSVIPHYQTAVNAARLALQKTKSPGTNSIHYWIGRLEFGIDYMNAIEAVRAAATAESNKDFSGAFTETTRAVDLIKHGLTAY